MLSPGTIWRHGFAGRWVPLRRRTKGETSSLVYAVYFLEAGVVLVSA